MAISKTKLAICAGVSGLALSFSLGAAMAQDTSEAVPAVTNIDDEILVTGFRQSLEAALATKREDNGIVDAIVAEDIADFPDLNLAESLQRIPGVSIDRQAGEGRRITVRGLGGDFTRVRINGMEALTTGGGSDVSGGTNRSRSFDFNSFASELFNQLVVRKSQSASIEEGSLGANVELKTAQPFDFQPGWTGSVSASGMYNDLSGNVGPRTAALLSYTSEDKVWGALVSVAYSKRKIQEDGFSTVRFDDYGTFRSVDGTTCASPLSTGCQDLHDAYYARIPRYGQLDYDQKRLGITGSIQFQPTDSTRLSIDGLYSKFDGSRDENFLEVFVRSNTDNIDVLDYAVNGDGVISYLYGDLQADTGNGLVSARSEHRRDEMSTDFHQITANLEQDFGDKVHANLFGGISRSAYKNPIQSTIFFDAAMPVTGYSYDFRDNPNAAAISFGDFDVTDPASFLFTQYRNRPQGVDNDYNTVQGNISYEMNDAITMRGGFSWKQFKFSTYEGRAEGDVEDLPGFSAAIPVTDSIAELLTGFGDGLDAPSGIDTSWISADWQAAVDLIDLLNIAPIQRAQDTRGVEEKDLGGYVQFDYNFDMGGMPVRGDFGVRYVKTKTAATGYVGDVEATVDRDYEDFLPAFNVVLAPAEDFLIRMGYAKVMARPSLGNLTPGGSVDSFVGPPFAINMGNPDLDPYRATNLDVSFEWYFAPESVLAVSLFLKDIDSYFTRSAVVETTFSQTGLPETVASPTSPLYQDYLGLGLDPAVEVSQVANGDNANVKGIEVVFQQPFSSLPGLLSHTGFTGNYTYVTSDKIIGFSPNSFNATLYYEDDSFSARITGAYRDAYVTTNPSSSGRTEGREERGVASTFNLDFSSSYRVNDSIKLTFEVVNITDEYEHQTFDMLMLPTVYQHTGRNFIFGARYDF